MVREQFSLRNFKGGSWDLRKNDRRKAQSSIAFPDRRGFERRSLTLADDGVGIPPRNPRSSGLQLIAGLAEQLGADVAWEVRPGTTLRLRLSGTFARVQDDAERREESQQDTRETILD